MEATLATSFSPAGIATGSKDQRETLMFMLQDVNEAVVNPASFLDGPRSK
jgi:hypothetical protein